MSILKSSCPCDMTVVILFFSLGSPTIIPTVAEKPKRQLVAAIQGMCNTYVTNPDIQSRLYVLTSRRFG